MRVILALITLATSMYAGVNCSSGTWSGSTCTGAVRPVVYHVCSGPTGNTTTTCPSSTGTGDVTELQAVFDDALDGDTVRLEAGAVWTNSGVMLAIKTGITLEGSNYSLGKMPATGTRITPVYAPLMPQIRMPQAVSSLPALGVRASSTGAANNVTIRGIYFAPNPSATSATIYSRGMLLVGALVGSDYGGSVTDITHQPTGTQIYHCLFIGDRITPMQLRFGVKLEGRSAVVRDNYIEGLMGYAGSEGHGISSLYGQGPFTIENNYINSSTENIFTGGAYPFIIYPSAIYSSGTVQYNYLPHRMARERSATWTANTYVEKGRYMNRSAATTTWVIAQNTGCTGASEPVWDTVVNNLTTESAAGTNQGSPCPTGTPSTPVTWKYVGSNNKPLTKNNFELKGGDGWTVRYNVMRGMWNDSAYGGQETAINIKSENHNARENDWSTTPYVMPTAVPQAVVAGELWLRTRSSSSLIYAVTVSGTTDVPTISDLTNAAAGTTVVNGTATFYVHAAVGCNADTSPYPACADSGTRNFTFTSNRVDYNDGGSMKLVGGTNGVVSFYGNMYVKNNLFRQVTQNSAFANTVQPLYVQFSRRTSGTANTVGWTLPFEVENNTWISNWVGPFRGLVLDRDNAPLTNMPAGSKLRYNIWLREAAMGARMGSTNEGTNIDWLLNCGGSCTSTQFAKNIIIGVATTTYPANEVFNNCSTTTVGGTNCISSTSSPIPWTNDYNPTGLNPAGDGILFRDYATGDYTIRPKHPWAKRSGALSTDIGADLTLIPDIHNLQTTVLGRKVLVTWDLSRSNKDIPCVGELNTQPDMSGTYLGEVSSGSIGTYYRRDSSDYVTNLKRGLFRMLVFGASVPLPENSPVFGRLQCGGDVQDFSFTTTTTLAGTTTVRVKNSDTTTLRYGYVYSNATNTITDETSTLCSAGVCTITGVPKGSVLYYKTSATGAIKVVGIVGG